MNTFVYIDEDNREHRLYFVSTSYVDNGSLAIIAYEEKTNNRYFVSIWHPQKTESLDGFWINSIQCKHLVQFLIREKFIDVNARSSCLTIIENTALFEGVLTDKAKKYLCLS
jgi:hypothetical protein